ncbi:protein lin-52 homolog [Cotesia glomerata]|uniref:protein lin-52 homolog n=1 Tax=Cotesia glomerata TaxID=32391 RepID=UPI001D01B1CE|nr:protein lin-52 homolog [Cotesia glomerata]
MSSSEESDSISTESFQDLKCSEELDRSSPTLWPKHLVEKFVHKNNVKVDDDGDSWKELLFNIQGKDLLEINDLSKLTMLDLIARAKKIQDWAYELELEETKEINRAKYLGIFEK